MSKVVAHDKMVVIKANVAKMLEAYPAMRNTTDWEFICNYWDAYVGLTEGGEFSHEVIKTIGRRADPESIRRARQKLCAPEIAALAGHVKRARQSAPQYVDPDGCRREHAKAIAWFLLKGAKYIPTDLGLIEKKRVKMADMRRFVLEALGHA